ncbi:sulfite exporter TauE/SafE family protein [Achromobacter mucicolens]|jgi:uncharacterized membrane protein YfcA|nr:MULTISPECIES: sulfite exporter TauE/SafE family protein [Achromobacter]MDG9970294.1 sulfite exporter TauE/SafE family protein [Achromobacter mucicolens]MDH1181261.1 sulfite exporter TauE/SafE family protein [Achromobacter mucicolens]
MTFEFIPHFLGLAALGVASGFLAGLLGIGGGIVLVPVLTFFLQGQELAAGLAVKMAIATSMAVILFTSFSSVSAHHRRGAVDWQIVRGLTPGIVAGSLISSLGVFALLKGNVLAVVFSVFMLFSAVQMFRGRQPAAARGLPGAPGLLGAGSAIGALSGLVGVGGGFISVPFLSWCNVPVHRAVATSAALGFPIALANVGGFILGGLDTAGRPAHSMGFVWTPGLALVAAFSVLTAPLGARAAHRLPVARLKRAFAGMLFAVSAYMLITGVRGA